MPIKKKILAVLLSIILIIVLIHSLYYVQAHTHHVCTGENCPICQQLQVADGILTSFRQLIPLVSLLLAIIAILFSLEKGNLPIHQSAHTLVSLKVLLRN